MAGSVNSHLGQYANTTGHRAYCYTELTVKSKLAYYYSNFCLLPTNVHNFGTYTITSNLMLYS